MKLSAFFVIYTLSLSPNLQAACPQDQASLMQTGRYLAQAVRALYAHLLSSLYHQPELHGRTGVLLVFSGLSLSIIADLNMFDTKRDPIEVISWDLAEIAGWFVLGMP